MEINHRIEWSGWWSNHDYSVYILEINSPMYPLFKMVGYKLREILVISSKSSNGHRNFLAKIIDADESDHAVVTNGAWLNEKWVEWISLSNTIAMSWPFNFVTYCCFHTTQDQTFIKIMFSIKSNILLQMIVCKI